MTSIQAYRDAIEAAYQKLLEDLPPEVRQLAEAENKAWMNYVAYVRAEEDKFLAYVETRTAQFERCWRELFQAADKFLEEKRL